MTGDNESRQQIQSFVRRIEALEDEIKVLNEDKSEVYKEAKGNGFDTKVLRKVIAARRVDASDRMEQDALFDLYMEALGEVAHAHVEKIEEFDDHDPGTGEVVDTSSTAARKDVPGPLRMTPASVPQPEPQDRIGGLGNDPEAASLAAGTQAPPVETPEPEAPASAGAEVDAIPSPRPPSNVTTFRTHDPDKHFLNSEGRLRLHGCIKPDMCGSDQPRAKLCFSCSVQRDDEAVSA